MKYLKVRGAYMTIKDFLYTYQKGMIYTEKGNGTQDSWYLEEKRKIIIPDYQREYRWEEKQLIELVDDISKGQCYLGQIAVSRIANEPKNYYLVDGQQRITSIIILLTVLNRQFYIYHDYNNFKRFELHKAENNKDGDNLSRLLFETNCFDNFQSFLSQIYFLGDNQLLNSQFEHAKKDSYLQEERYINACTKLHIKIQKHMELRNRIPEKLDYVKDLIRKVLETQISVVIFEGDSSYESERVFLDINEKGLQLDNEDTLKAYYFKTVSDENGKEALEIWQSLKEAYYNIKEVLDNTKIPLVTFVNYAFQTDLLMSDGSWDYSKFDSDLRYKDKSGKKHICELYIDTNLHNSMQLVVLFFQEINDLLQNDSNSNFYRQYFGKRDSTTRQIFKFLFNTICRSDMSIIFMALIKFWWLRKQAQQSLFLEDIIQLFSFYIISNVSGLKKERQLFAKNNFISSTTLEDTYQNLHIIEIQMLKDSFSKITTLKRDQEKGEFLSFNIQMFYNDFHFNESRSRWEIAITNQEFLAQYSANREKYIKDHFLIQNGKEIKLFNGDIFQITQSMILLRKRAYNFIYHKDDFDNIDFISRLNKIKNIQADGQQGNSNYGKYEKDYFSFIEKQLAAYFEIDNKFSSATWEEVKNRYSKELPAIFPKIISYILEEHIYSWNNLVCKKFENQFSAKLKSLANNDLI